MAGRQRHAVNEANQNAGVNILLGSIDTAPRVDVRVAATYRERNVVVQSSPTEIATFPWESTKPELEIIASRLGRAFTEEDLKLALLLQVSHPKGDGKAFACSLYNDERVDFYCKDGTLVANLNGPRPRHRVKHFSEQHGLRLFVLVLVKRSVVARVKSETTPPPGLVGSALERWFAMHALTKYPATAIEAAGIAPPVHFRPRLGPSGDAEEEWRQIFRESREPGAWIKEYILTKEGQENGHGDCGASEHPIEPDARSASIAAALATAAAASTSASAAAAAGESRIGDSMGSGTVTHQETVTLHGVRVPTETGFKTATVIAAVPPPPASGDDGAAIEVYTKPQTHFGFEVDLQCSDFGASVKRNDTTGRAEVVISDRLSAGEKWTPVAQVVQQRLQNHVKADSNGIAGAPTGPADVLPPEIIDADVSVIPTSHNTGDQLSRVIFDKPSIQAALNAYTLYHTQSVDGKQKSDAFASILSRGLSRVGHFPGRKPADRSPPFTCQIVPQVNGGYVVRLRFSSKFDQNAIPASGDQLCGITVVLRMKNTATPVGASASAPSMVPLSMSSTPAAASPAAASSAASPVADFVVVRSRPFKVLTKRKTPKTTDAASTGTTSGLVAAGGDGDDDDDDAAGDRPASGGGADGSDAAAAGNGLVPAAARAAASSTSSSGAKSKLWIKKKTTTARTPGAAAASRAASTTTAAAAAPLAGRKRGTDTRPVGLPAAGSSKHSKWNQQQPQDSYSPPTVATSDGSSADSTSASDPPSLPSSTVSSPSFSASSASAAELPVVALTALEAIDSLRGDTQAADIVQGSPSPALSSPLPVGLPRAWESSFRAMESEANEDLQSMERRMSGVCSNLNRSSERFGHLAGHCPPRAAQPSASLPSCPASPSLHPSTNTCSSSSSFCMVVNGSAPSASADANAALALPHSFGNLDEFVSIRFDSGNPGAPAASLVDVAPTLSADHDRFDDSSFSSRKLTTDDTFDSDFDNFGAATWHSSSIQHLDYTIYSSSNVTDGSAFNSSYNINQQC